MIMPLSPYSAALVKTQKTRIMVIADLHIGWEMALSKKGIHVPPQTPKLLTRLLALISAYRPDSLLILGDVKHTVATAEIGEWHDIPDFFSELKKQVRNICVIRGNHDGNLEPLLPENVRLLPSTGIVLERVGFFHGHQWPSPAILRSRTLVMGHIHPVVAFRDPAGFRIVRQVWVKINCDKMQLAKVLLEKHRLKVKNSLEEGFLGRHKNKPETIQLLIMPSFNDFLGGRPLNERRLTGADRTGMIAGPMLRSGALNMEKAETYLLDGTFLGTLNQLEALG